MDQFKDWIIHGLLCLPRHVNSTAPRYPAQLALPIVGSGSLTAGDYFYKVRALDNSGDPIYWISNEVGTNVPASSKISLSWDFVPGASTYRVYRGTATQAENQYVDVIVTSLDDDGLLSWTAGSPSGTEYTHKVLNDVALGGATFVCLTGTTAENTDITGFAGGVNGRLLILYLENVSQITIRQESVWSSAANRVFTLRHQACTANWHINKQIRDLPDISFADKIALDGKTIHVFIWHPNIISGSGRWLHLFSNGNNLG